MAHIKRSITTLIALGLLIVIVAAAFASLNFKVYVVHTGSMTPTIPSRSAVVVRLDHYRLGQVASFRHNNEVITHRLIATSPDGSFTTKGDGNSTRDTWQIRRSDIIGGVVAAPQMVGYWIVYFRNPLGLASVLLTLVCIWQIWSCVGLASEPKLA